MRIGFSLLGRVTVRIDDHPVVLPAGRPQVLLAALLMGRGGRLSADRLIGALWDEPPPSAATNLRTHMTRLRAALGPHRDRLARAGAGYVLAVEPGELDLHHFEDALRDARRAEREGRPDLTADLLGAGLALWSGEAAEGLPRFGAVGRSLDALDEAHHTAVERYAAACVEAGRYRAAATALRPLVADQPVREAAWETLVLALARAGDRGEALAACAAAGAALREELGRGAGRVLGELERDLLEGDASPAAAHDASSGPGAGVEAPSTLPPAVGLVGRTGLLARVVAEASDPGVVVLHGSAGVGKSALAVEAAHRLAPRYPDGLLHLDLSGSSPGLTPMTVEEAVSILLRALGARPASGTPAVELAELQARCRDRRMLVILNNVVDAAQIRRLLPALGGAAVLVTSRTPLPTVDARQTAVGELPAEESVALLARHVGADRVARAPDDARSLAALCGHLPLALRIIGARLAHHPEWTIEAAVGRLADEQYRLDELACDDLAVRASLALTCSVLADRPGGPAALVLFDRWGTVCAPVLGPELARVLTGGTEQQARAALDRLAEAGLAEACGEDRYRMHDLVRIYAVERGRADPDGHRALHLARCYFLDTARRARDLLRPDPHRPTDGFAEPVPTVRFDDTRDALRWLEAERGNLLAAARLALREETPEADLFAARLPIELYPFLPMRGYYRDWQELAAGALRCARRLGSRTDEAAALTHLAVAQSRLGEPERAVDGLRAALALREADGDPRSIAVTLDHLGALLAGAGRLAESRACFLRSLDLHRVHGDPRHLGVTLNNFADVLLQLGETDLALRHLEESLRLRRDLDDALGIGITMLTIGQVHARDGRCEQAYRWLEDALTAARDTGNREAEWRALTVRADLHRASGLRGEARCDLHAALALSEEIGDAAGTAEVREALAALEADLPSLTA